MNNTPELSPAQLAEFEILRNEGVRAFSRYINHMEAMGEPAVDLDAPETQQRMMDFLAGFGAGAITR